ncbi:hypothetical protein NP233_g1678 [Leucocoprinus birnbaumii]|uniref:Protein transport protein SFT2 n=1 Tax=Leucocoprinus birnbaumii TaxID=56174 RepID=A0AAD5YZC3_9AGAR|nr:hypothetical protein NP233_g1678 [Leucocoprinus birnbaumii]
MPGKGWFNLEAGTSVVPETQFFEGDSAFKFLGLSKTTRLYGFFAWYELFSHLAGISAVVDVELVPLYTRVLDFLFSLAIGFLLSLLGAIVLFLGQLGSFAVLYVFGTVISLIGTGFIIGFFRQLKLMFKPIRVVATIVFLASIGLVFVAAFVLKSDILCIIFVIIEYLAYTWYTLSYIPYARSAVLKVFGMA